MVFAIKRYIVGKYSCSSTVFLHSQNKSNISAKLTSNFSNCYKVETILKYFHIVEEWYNIDGCNTILNAYTKYRHLG